LEEWLNMGSRIKRDQIIYENVSKPYQKIKDLFFWNNGLIWGVESKESNKIRSMELWLGMLFLLMVGYMLFLIESLI
jgi:hypothetical protein